MNLVDSCGWIEYFSDSAYADFYSEAIEDTSNLIVPVICIMEVFKKIYLERNENSALVAAAHMQLEQFPTRRYTLRIIISGV